ncbi:unnamed protein product [Brugia pahangi]|uniref:Secreted protein n=1 Tax=Brugia pahangi TaxID=6280 RepID=A0A0N4T456_BRUPA|nr:unnamed protein product [Brugia pahangi]
MRPFICVHATHCMQLNLAHLINGISLLQLVTFKIAIRNFARKPSSIVCVAAQNCVIWEPRNSAVREHSAQMGISVRSSMVIDLIITKAVT